MPPEGKRVEFSYNLHYFNTFSGKCKLIFPGGGDGGVINIGIRWIQDALFAWVTDREKGILGTKLGCLFFSGCMAPIKFPPGWWAGGKWEGICFGFCQIDRGCCEGETDVILPGQISRGGGFVAGGSGRRGGREPGRPYRRWFGRYRLRGRECAGWSAPGRSGTGEAPETA